MESLIEIRSEQWDQGTGGAATGKQDVNLAVVVAESLLCHSDLDVVKAVRAQTEHALHAQHLAFLNRSAGPIFGGQAARGLGAIGVSSNKVMYALLDKLDHGHRYVLHEVCVALVKLGFPWPDICRQVRPGYVTAARAAARAPTASSCTNC